MPWYKNADYLLWRRLVGKKPKKEEEDFLYRFNILDAITTKVNLYNLATFSMIKTFQLVIIFASLGHNHFVY